MFFSEEKNQKTFTFYATSHLSGHGLDPSAGAELKVFCFFSSEKKAFLVQSRNLRVEYAYIGRQTRRLNVSTNAAITSMPSSTRAVSPRVVASWM